jgi:hypothetical protein
MKNDTHTKVTSSSKLPSGVPISANATELQATPSSVVTAGGTPATSAAKVGNNAKLETYNKQARTASSWVYFTVQAIAHSTGFDL